MKYPNNSKLFFTEIKVMNHEQIADDGYAINLLKELIPYERTEQIARQRAQQMEQQAKTRLVSQQTK